ncbi:MAG: GAF domain-containing protein [Actinobacteria bacterium]|nr:MAG: GAF domain-containing protein [Actinomycetota bacterium]
MMGPPVYGGSMGDSPDVGPALGHEGTTSLQLLLDSFVAITSELSAAAILERAVDLARLLTSARYGAAVALDNGEIAEFVHAGLTNAQFNAMPHLPLGKGMLGAVLQQKTPIRLEVLQSDPRSVGFPLGHVPMTAFLGVPIFQETDLVGALYLTKSPGQGLFSQQDELFMISLANQTAVALETAHLIQRLNEKTAIVQLMQDVAVGANEARDVDEALQVTLDRVCAHTGWPVGHVYTLEKDGTHLMPSTLWHVEDTERYEQFRRVTEAMPLEIGAGLPGRVAANGKPAWVTDVMSDPNFPRALTAVDLGVVAGFAFPVLVGSEVVAVLEFFSPVALVPDPTLLDVMANIGTQLGRVVERDRIAAEMRRVDVLKSEFIANAAHELRTPLTSLLGFADLAASRGDELGEEVLKQVMDGLGRQADRIRGLIENLLDLSQIQQGRLTVRLLPTALGDAVRRALDAAPPPEGRSVTVELDEDAKGVADLQRLDQIIVNLLTNAYRYGGPSIKIEASAAAQSCSLVIFDDGHGVPDEVRTRIFEPFARGWNTSGSPGSGLGLAICRRLVEAFGGVGASRTVTVTSAVP